MTTPSHPTEALLTIAEAADRLRVKPWDVVRLIESGDLPSVALVPASALRAPEESK